MIPQQAIIESSGDDSSILRVCGLYLLERNILLLSRSGVKTIYLRLSEQEESFYRKKIEKRVRTQSEIIVNTPNTLTGTALVITSRLFMQAHNLAKHEEYFTLEKNSLVPVLSNEVFEVSDRAGALRAEELLIRNIRENTPGFIARRINKAVSLPISRVLSRTRIHPNYLTVLNMIVGFSSAFLIAQNTYLAMALGGLFFQLASVFDGVDGEVAKMTLKVSKLGGWLDTISDNGTLLLFLTASSYLFFINSASAVLPLVFIALLFLGLGVMLAAMISFLRKHTDSGSLVTYDKEFLQKLPDTDPIVSLVHRMKYFTKKEFFSIAFFVICLTGKIYWLVPFISVVMVAAAILLMHLNSKYRNFTIGSAS